MVERRTTSMKLDPEVWRKAGHVAIDEGITKGVLVENALKEYFERHPTKRSR